MSENISLLPLDGRSNSYVHVTRSRPGGLHFGTSAQGAKATMTRSSAAPRNHLFALESGLRMTTQTHSCIAICAQSAPLSSTLSEAHDSSTYELWWSLRSLHENLALEVHSLQLGVIQPGYHPQAFSRLPALYGILGPRWMFFDPEPEKDASGCHRRPGARH
jgi:hypothetical protein